MKVVTGVVEYCFFLLKLLILVDWSFELKGGGQGGGKKGEGVAKHGRSLGDKPHCEVVADFSVFMNCPC